LKARWNFFFSPTLKGGKIPKLLFKIKLNGKLDFFNSPFRVGEPIEEVKRVVLMCSIQK